MRATVHVDRPLYYDYEVVTGRATLALNSKKPPGRSRAHTHATSQYVRVYVTLPYCGHFELVQHRHPEATVYM